MPASISVAVALKALKHGGGGPSSVGALRFQTLATAGGTGSDFTTMSSTFVDITGVTVTPTALAGERWLVNCDISCFADPGGQSLITRLLLDGSTALRDEHMVNYIGGGNYNTSRAFSALTPALAAGAHTVKMQGRIVGGQTGHWELSSPVTDALTRIQVVALRTI